MDKSKGLGDDIKKITAAIGLDKVAEKIAEITNNGDCGCEQRRQMLNERFPYD